ncbi:mitochondrial processing peptidase beta subunit, partial [Cladochytrium tenue]
SNAAAHSLSGEPHLASTTFAPFLPSPPPGRTANLGFFAVVVAAAAPAAAAMLAAIARRSASALPKGGRSLATTSLTTANPSTKSVEFTYAQSLGNIPETKITRLPNGLTVATESNPNQQAATVGFWVKSGSRFESKTTNGTAHFLEHVLFKGTKTKPQKDLETQIEALGGSISSYTSREQSAFFAKVLASDASKAAEVLSDLLLNPEISDASVNSARDGILREAEVREGLKADLVFDHLHGSAFQSSSLGQTVIGPKTNVESITRADLLSYKDEVFTPDRIVLAASGGVDHDALVKVAEKYFGSLKASESKPTVLKPTFVGSDLRARYDELPAAHVILGVEGASWTNPDYWPLAVAQFVIGSWDRNLPGGSKMSSRLIADVQKDNLLTSFSAFNIAYSDTGLFGVYGVSNQRETLEEVSHVIQQEWHRLAMAVTDAEVFRAKNQLKASLLLGKDGTTAAAEDIGSQLLTYGKRITPWELDGLIEAVKAADVARVAAKYIYDKEVCLIGYGPVEALQDYTRIRGAMSPIYW